MADRVGPRKSLITTVLNVSLATGVMALTPDQVSLIFLTVCQFFAAVGSAGLLVTAVPLMQEFVPASKRGWVGGLVIAAISLGLLALLLEGRLVVALLNLRFVDGHAVFALGLLPTLVALLIRVWVPESPRWLIHVGRFEDARLSLARVLRTDPIEIAILAVPPNVSPTPWYQLFRYRRSVAVSCLISLAQIGGAATALWGGVSVSVLKFGWSNVAHLMFGVIAAGLVGQFIMAYLSDAIGRRSSGMLCGFGAAACLALAGVFYDAFLGTVSVFWLLLVITSFFGLGSMAVIRPYTAEVWPSGLRASGMGLAYGFGSLGGVVAWYGLQFLPGSPGFLDLQVTPRSILPVTLFLAAWYGLAGLVFWLLAMET
jgi:MFS transporter, putative metabolite:H+ symporter